MANLTTIESVLTAFPYPTIPPIVGPPTYETINEVAALLKANAASIHSENGGGQLGYLALTVSPAVYATLSNGVAFVVPNNPQAFPPPLGGHPTVAQIQANQRQHAENLRLFRLYQTVQGALKQQLISAVPDIYLRTLRHRHTGYASVTCYQLLHHLFITYGRMTPMDHQVNDTRFRSSYDPAQPFETFIQQIEDAQDYADAGGQAYTPEQIVSNAYTIMFNTGMFVDTCREWRRKPVADQTWANFKTEFSLAHTDLGNMRNTTQAAGFHQAHNAFHMEAFATETAEAFANMANATSADRDMLLSLQASNQALLQQLTVKDAELTQLRQQVQQFQAGLSNRTTNSNNNRRNNANPNAANRAPNTEPTQKRYPNLNYCWTHGHDIDPRHDSSNCRNPGPGHQNNATRTNPMGGSTKNKDRVPN